MKNWIPSIVLLLLAISLSGRLLACGPYYPYGESVRFRVINPVAFGFGTFYEFNYSAGITYTMYHDHMNEPENILPVYDENIALWKTYCKGQVSEAAIDECVYALSADSVSIPQPLNDMVRYLQRTGDTAAINYLVFAKQCESLNRFYNDPWERNEGVETVNPLPQRDAIIAAALNRASHSGTDYFRRRYAFLAIRMAYYNHSYGLLKETYKQYFTPRHQPNIIDFWSLHFRTLIEPDGPLRNFFAAQVFYHAPDKRLAIYQSYRADTAVALTLKYAKTDEEKAAVWLLQGVRTPDRALECITQLYRYAPRSEAAGFLVLRELNKLEDWIYTPKYTFYEPSIRAAERWDRSTSSKALSNVAKDQLYARQLLAFIQKVNIRETQNPALWHTAKAYLNCMIGDYSQALAILQKTQEVRDTAVIHQQQLVKGLCLTAMQATGHATIPEMVKPLLMQEARAHNYRYLFAIGRELEMKGNTTDAAMLFSKMDGYKEDESEWEEQMFWRTRKNHNTLYADFYENYFYYLDAQYTPAQLEALLAAVHKGPGKDSFSRWEYKIAAKEYPRLQDLLGTKYIRQNRLQEALSVFEKINDTLWHSEAYNYKYLAANPFYTNMYNEHQRTAADSIAFTKTTITRQLICILKKANNPRTRQRDYYYFLAANCYLNMTQYGNSWMMRRYYWTGAETRTKLADDPEYFNCDLARQYYLKAKEVSRSRKFSALCLRMAGRCEKYRLYNQVGDKYGGKRDEQIFQHNRYYTQIRREYPAYYEDLMSNCEAFGTYFSAR